MSGSAEEVTVVSEELERKVNDLEDFRRKLEEGSNPSAAEVRESVTGRDIGELETVSEIPGEELETGYLEKAVLHEGGFIEVELDTSDSRSFNWINGESGSSVEFFTPVFDDSQVTLIGPYGSLFRYDLEADEVRGRSNTCQDLVREIGNHAGMEYAGLEPGKPDYEQMREAVQRGRFSPRCGESDLLIGNKAQKRLKKAVKQPEKAEKIYSTLERIYCGVEGDLEPSEDPDIRTSTVDIYKAADNFYLVTDRDSQRVMNAGSSEQMKSDGFLLHS